MSEDADKSAWPLLPSERDWGPWRLGIALATAGAAYPRQRLLHALCLLLWEASPPTEAMLLRRVQREIRTRATSFAGLVAAYEQLWHRFN